MSCGNGFTGSGGGFVPGSGGGGGSAAPIGAPDFGTGEDGALVFDGAANVLGIAPVAGVYTMNGRLINATDIQIDAGVTVKITGAPMLWIGVLSGSGTISVRGNSAFDRSGGVAVANATLPGSPAGGQGGLNGVGGAAPGASSASTYLFPTSVGGTAGAFPNGVGGNGNTGCGGGGGGGFTAGVTGGATTLAAGANDFRHPDAWKVGRIIARTQFFTMGAGGAGGSGGGTGGGGGAGGAYLLCMGYDSTFTGVLDARGGNGHFGVVSGANQSGGGGGGGGGIIRFCVGMGTLPSSLVTGGIGGAGTAGGNGGNGGAGFASIWRMS